MRKRGWEREKNNDVNENVKEKKREERQEKETGKIEIKEEKELMIKTNT